MFVLFLTYHAIRTGFDFSKSKMASVPPASGVGSLRGKAPDDVFALVQQFPLSPTLDDANPFLLACRTGDDATLRLLLIALPRHSRPEYVNTCDAVSESMLMSTVRSGAINCALLLLDQGADPNHANHQRNTALHLACQRLHGPMIELLIRYGAEVNRVNDSGQLPAQLAPNPKEQPALNSWMSGLVTFYINRVWLKAENRLSAQQRAVFRRSFDALDTDEDGYLNRAEVEAYLAQSGLTAELIMLPNQAVAFFDWLDSGRHGRIDFSTWLQFCLRLCICGIPNQLLEHKANLKALKKYACFYVSVFGLGLVQGAGG